MATKELQWVSIRAGNRTVKRAAFTKDISPVGKELLKLSNVNYLKGIFACFRLAGDHYIPTTITNTNYSGLICFNFHSVP